MGVSPRNRVRPTSALWAVVIALHVSGCAGIVPTCGMCIGLGGAWLPESDTCADTCEEQAEGILCVEKVCPGSGPATRAEADTCEECILLGGTWQEETGVCADACGDDLTCFTTRCPDS